MAIVLDIRLKKVNKVYHDGDVISGVVFMQSNSDFKHDGITLTAEGTVNLQLSAKNVGIIEAFYQSVKPIQLVTCSMEIASAGKIPAGRTEIPFEFLLTPRMNKTLYETYHGVFVNIQYHLRAEMKRPFLAKDLVKDCEFIVEYHPDKCEKAQQHPVSFTITPDSLQNVKDRHNVPRFLVRGKFDSTICSITKPFTGELVVEHCEVPIKSVELQLVRVETCGCAEGYAKDATEIQNIQIGEGDVPTNLAIPIYMIFPRLFTCPTLATSNFKVEFEINIVIIFQDDHLITENFPIILTRRMWEELCNHQRNLHRCRIVEDMKLIEQTDHKNYSKLLKNNILFIIPVLLLKIFSYWLT